VNSDYALYNATRWSGLRTFFVSYDIMCQYGMKLDERMQKFPDWPLRKGNDVQVNLLIPKFHLPAHVQDCLYTFSFNFGLGCARVDGESLERSWFITNMEATGTKEMGPGGRRDTLDDSFDQANYRKGISLGESVQKLTTRIVTNNGFMQGNPYFTDSLLRLR
jgi:hypothetical protein